MGQAVKGREAAMSTVLLLGGRPLRSAAIYGRRSKVEGRGRMPTSNLKVRHCVRLSHGGGRCYAMTSGIVSCEGRLFLERENVRRKTKRNDCFGLRRGAALVVGGERATQKLRLYGPGTP